MTTPQRNPLAEADLFEANPGDSIEGHLIGLIAQTNAIAHGINSVVQELQKMNERAQTLGCVEPSVPDLSEMLVGGIELGSARETAIAEAARAEAFAEIDEAVRGFLDDRHVFAAELQGNKVQLWEPLIHTVQADTFTDALEALKAATNPTQAATSKEGEA